MDVHLRRPNYRTPSCENHPFGWVRLAPTGHSETGGMARRAGSADAGVPAGSGAEPLDVDAVIDVPLSGAAAGIGQIAGRYRDGASG